MDGSTVTLIATSLPVTPFSAAFNSVSCAALKRMGRGDVGGNFAARFGSDAAIGLDHARHREEAAIVGDDTQEVPDQAADLGLVGNCRNGLRNWSSAENTGLLISRSKSGLEASNLSKEDRSASTLAIAFDSEARSNSERA